MPSDTTTSSLPQSSHPNPKPRLRGRTPKLCLGCQRYSTNLKNTPRSVWRPHCREALRVCAISTWCPGKLSWHGSDTEPTPPVRAQRQVPVCLFSSGRGMIHHGAYLHTPFSAQDFNVIIHSCMFKHLPKQMSWTEVSTAAYIAGAYGSWILFISTIHIWTLQSHTRPSISIISPRAKSRVLVCQMLLCVSLQRFVFDCGEIAISLWTTCPRNSCLSMKHTHTGNF